MIDMDKFPQHLKTIGEDQWRRLFDLPVIIQQPQSFGKLNGLEESLDRTMSVPYWSPKEVVYEFFDVVNELEITPVFDWTNWKEGKDVLKNPNSNYENLEAVTLCKFLTTIVRADKFSDGYLVSCFSDGTIEKIILALKNKITSQEI